MVWFPPYCTVVLTLGPVKKYPILFCSFPKNSNSIFYHLIEYSKCCHYTQIIVSFKVGSVLYIRQNYLNSKFTVMWQNKSPFTLLFSQVVLQIYTHHSETVMWQNKSPSTLLFSQVVLQIYTHHSEYTVSFNIYAP